MNAKLKSILMTILAATLIIFLCGGACMITFADTAQSDPVIEAEETVDEPDSTEQPQNLENGATGEGNVTDEETYGLKLEELTAQFTEYLKQRYGADYEYYYNKIIENWGSVEAYLLAFGEQIPEEYRTGWDKFVGWLGNNAPVWAPALAVVLVIIAAVVGKKQFNAIVDKIVNSKLSPIVNELNLQSNASIATMHALKSLMGTNEKFSDTVKELDESEKELTGNE